MRIQRGEQAREHDGDPTLPRRFFDRWEPRDVAPQPKVDFRFNDSLTRNLSMSQHSTPPLFSNPPHSSSVLTHSSPVTDTASANPSGTPRSKMPVMVSRPPTPRRLLKRSHALGESLEYRAVIQAIPTHSPTIDDIQLNKLAVGFEKFFWRPTEENRKQLMAAIADIRQNAHALQGLDASTLVSRILHCNGLFKANTTPHLMNMDDIRSAVAATLECLANTQAILFNTGAPESLAQLLPTAKENDLLPELAALIAGDLALCGEHRIIESIWDHADRTGLPLPTLMILIQLSEYFGYPVPADVPVVKAAKLIRDWCDQPPTEDEQAQFDAQLLGMTHSDISPEAFENLLQMALDLEFSFTEDSLARLIGQLLHEWKKHPRRDQYGMKLDTVFRLTGLPANDVLINGERALIEAAQTANERLLALLLDHGANPDQIDARQRSAVDALLRKREDLMAEIAAVVKAENQFTRQQYQKITKRLLSQLNSNERMFNLLDTARHTRRARETHDAVSFSDQ